MDDDRGIASGLEGLIRANRSATQDIAIRDLRRIVGGNSSEIWAFDASWTEAGALVGYKLILRRASPNEFSSAGRAAEFRLLQALADTPVPAPKAFWFDADGAFLERAAMVMERVDGSADRNLLGEDNRSGLDASSRTTLGGEIADILAAIHRLDAGALALADGMQADAQPARQQLAFYDAEIARQAVEPMPELRLASHWLHQHLPKPPARQALVHGDYRPANVLVDGGRILAVLDWEFAHVGDPAEDLGWYVTPYYAREHFIPGRWSAEDFLARYEAALGARVDRDAVRFWSVFALYKLASMTMAALEAFTDGDWSRMTPSARFIIDPLLRSISEGQQA